MYNNTKTIQTLASIGLGLHILYTVLYIGIRFFPEPLLALFSSSAELLDAADVVHHPLMFVMPLVSLGIYFLLYYLLRTQIQTPTSFSGALIAIILAAMVMLAAGSRIFSGMIAARLIAVLRGTAALAAYSSVNTILSWLDLVDVLAFPLLLLAAGMLHGRNTQA